MTFLRIADLTLSVDAGPDFEASEPSFEPFLIDAATDVDVAVRARSGALPETLFSPDQCLFDSGGCWSLYDSANGQIFVQRDLDGGVRDTLSVKAPCVLGATKGLNEPRYPKLPQILKAKKKEIKEIDLSALGIADSAMYRIKHLEPVQERSNAKILEGSTAEKVASLVKILREEEKVI